ncbi:unnamed protein product [Jaminaea pallidilutea]
MLSSVIHQPCEVTLHLLSEDIFIHPPPVGSELPGKDESLRGVVEIKAPSERTITGLKVTLQGFQTLAIPDPSHTHASGLRWEEKTIMEKSMEVMGDGEGGIVKHHKNHHHVHHKGKGKAKEKSSPPTPVSLSGVQDSLPPAYAAADSADSHQPQVVSPESPDVESLSLEDHGGLHLTKGMHGFEFSFIIPASSPPFERCKHGRVRYIVTATALGAGRARGNIAASRDVFVILTANKHGGPTPLEIGYADVHEALGPISLSLTAASLTVGGTATLTLVHPDPPPKLNVHVVRIFIEQTFELYSEARKAWLKLPSEKLKVAEWGHMPNKPNRPAYPPGSLMTDSSDSLWLADKGYGHPGKGATHGAPHLAPYGTPISHMGGAGSSSNLSGRSPPLHTSGMPMSGGSSGRPTPSIHIPSAQNQQHQQNQLGSIGGRRGYKLKATVRMPNDDHMRPSTVRGSRAEIRVGHEMGVEVFFSRENVLDTRESSETFGKPKVQVFSARRALVVPSCTATFDTVHLPPYVQESPISSRPPSPSSLARSPVHVSNQSSSESTPNHSHTDLQRLAHTLHNTLPGGRGRPTPPHSKPTSNQNSRPGSRVASRDPSPTRPGLERGHSTHSISHSLSAAFGSHFHGHGKKSRPSSRASSPTRHLEANAANSPPISTNSAAAQPRGRRGFGMQGFTPASTQTVTAPASGVSTPITHHAIPRTLPPNVPWGASNLPYRKANSHDTCNCGRSTEELANAEHRLLEGVPTAPGAFSERHAQGEEPPAWSESRPPSPDYFSEVWANTASAVATPAGHRSKTPYGSPH